MITYKALEYNEFQIKELYEKNGWTAYTNNIDQLFGGIKSSLEVYAAYDEELLVGLIRVVGDNHVIIYIQDILVLPEYHDKGIGTRLINYVTKKYNHVRQIVLMTGKEEKQIGFYEKNSFKKMDSLDITGFVYVKNKISQ